MRIKVISLLLLTLAWSTIWAQNPKRTEYHRNLNRSKASNKSQETHTFIMHAKDLDGDGVLDINDKCPGVGIRGQVTPFGCPNDEDFDGVYDNEDACVAAPGPRENHGCPWTDTDEDGVYDKDDECITVKGKPEFHGCPDQDDDGIPDLLDNCPKEKGTWELKGCPPLDTDKDGVSDVDDLCPRTAGLIELRGCPPLKPEEKDAIKKAFDNLNFETNSDVIIESSYASLNDLVKVLMNNPTTRLRLEGHTDDVGDDDANLLLSRKRAAAVEKYLEDRGIPATRITSEGFGEKRPKLPNTNDGNRKVNRRVEMLLTYE